MILNIRRQGATKTTGYFYNTEDFSSLNYIVLFHKHFEKLQTPIRNNEQNF